MKISEKFLRFSATSIIILFVFIFQISGIGKLLDPVPTINALITTFSITFGMAMLIVVFISNGEIVLSLLLPLKRFRKKTMPILLFILVVFLLFLSYVYFKGIIIEDCGCFGGIWRRTIPEAIVEEIIFIILWGVYFLLQYKVNYIKALIK